MPALDPTLLDAFVDAVAARLAERMRAEPASGPASPPAALVSKQGLATALDVSTATVDRLVKEGRIPFFTVGDVKRFDLGEVRAVLRERTPQAVANADEPDAEVLVRYGSRRRRS